jgi:hypothetical protein
MTGHSELTLHLVVNNSRFLIAPTVKVKHLSSHVLARCQGQLAADWERVYHYRPVLLETYMERRRFAATCYRAANWRHIGVTRGRGRQGTGAPIKDIYVMVLAPSWQAELCRRADGAVRIRPEAPVRVAPDWIETELGGANLGDTRLTARLLQMTGMFYAKPTANIPEACGSSKATKAAYRFLDNEAVAWREILQAHYQATEDRIGEHRLVLVVQDTTTLNYARNVTMNANIMQAAVECGVRRILFASSIQVICGRRNDRDDPPTPSGLPYLPLDGESPPNPGNLYALSKLAGEQMLRYYVDQDHREAIAIRFPWTHQPGWSGPGARGFGMIDQAFAHLDVRDAGTLVAAILATDLPGYRIYLPTARGNLLRLPATQVIEKYYPNVPLRRPIAPDDSLVDVSRIECETGWRPAIE